MNEIKIEKRQPLLHVVLYQPDIPQNTGNIGRSCVAIGAKLWLIRPLGFQLESRYLKRAGMDYWEHLDWQAVDSWEELRQHLPEATVWCLTKFGSRNPWDATFSQGDILLFGSESRGLPESIRERYSGNCIRLPMHPEVRSLNLASTANAVMYEAVRQFDGI